MVWRKCFQIHNWLQTLQWFKLQNKSQEPCLRSAITGCWSCNLWYGLHFQRYFCSTIQLLHQNMVPQWFNWVHSEHSYNFRRIGLQQNRFRSKQWICCFFMWNWKWSQCLHYFFNFRQTFHFGSLPDWSQSCQSC